MTQKNSVPLIFSLILFVAVLAYSLHLNSEITELKKQLDKKNIPVTTTTEPAGEAELAPFMTELGTFTHKLQLAIDNKNSNLALFYCYETGEILKEIKTEAPNYGGHDIDGLIESMLEPYLESLKPILKDANNWLQDDKVIEKNWKNINNSFNAMLKSCNVCHEQTHHGYIKIARNASNPFVNQFD